MNKYKILKMFNVNEYFNVNNVNYQFILNYVKVNYKIN